MKRVGILGGTFDPIHNGHLLLAKAAYYQLCLDEILLMPSNNPPHKRNNMISDNESRLEMVRMACSDTDFLKASDFEMLRDGFTYTSDTLELLNKQYPDTRFYFIVGGDSIMNFENWHEPSLILHRCAIVASGRNGCSKEAVQNRIEELRDKYSEDGFTPEIYFLDIPEYNISSHEIRKLVSYDMPYSDYVSPAVRHYIEERSLYRNDFYDRVKNELKGLLKPSRYNHVISVAKTSVYLAKAHSVDTDKAYTAGLLHDCAKYLSDDDMLKAASDHNITLDEVETKAVQLVHSKVGAVFAAEKYGIDDDDIINSIWYHTTGRPGMTDLEKIIYIADVIEPLRTWNSDDSDLYVLRSVSLSDLDKCLYLVLKHTCDYLNNTVKDNLSPITFYTYQYYKAQIEARKEAETNDIR